MRGDLDGDPVVSVLPNVGPTVAEKLRAIGIETRSDLDAVGPLSAYAQLCRREGARLPVRHYLFGLEAALLGLRVADLPRSRRVELMRTAFDLPASTPSFTVRPRNIVRARRERGDLRRR